MNTRANTWPELDMGRVGPTLQTLHRLLQIAGKVRLQLSPARPNWLHSSLDITVRGVTTGPIPVGMHALQMDVDLVDHEIVVSSSDGTMLRLPLEPSPCVADLWDRVHEAFEDVGVELDLWEKPQEVSDITPLDSDDARCAYEPEAAGEWFSLMTAVRNVFEEWSSDFWGRTSIQLWWGGFDLTVLRFNGERVDPPLDRGYIQRWDISGEYMNAGFWPGNPDQPDPMFFAYISPPPPKPEKAPMPSGAEWSDEAGLWILRYGAFREAEDPAALLQEYLQAVYEYAGSAGGWQLDRFTYEKPRPSAREW